MCRNVTGRRVMTRWEDERGQTITEYVTLVGMATSIAIVVCRILNVSLREAFRSVAQRMLSVITGYP